MAQHVGNNIQLTHNLPVARLGFYADEVIQYNPAHSVAYAPSTIVIRNGKYFLANNTIPVGTAFAEGLAGATWRFLGIAKDHHVHLDASTLQAKDAANPTLDEVEQVAVRWGVQNAFMYYTQSDNASDPIKKIYVADKAHEVLCIPTCDCCIGGTTPTPCVPANVAAPTVDCKTFAGVSSADTGGGNITVTIQK